MPHNKHITPRGLWSALSVPTAKAFRQLDQYSSEVLAGTSGGTWAPEKPITLGGAVEFMGDFAAYGGIQTGKRSGFNPLIPYSLDPPYPGGILVAENIQMAARTIIVEIPIRDFLTRSDAGLAQGTYGYGGNVTLTYDESLPANFINYFNLTGPLLNFTFPLPHYRLFDGVAPSLITMRFAAGLKNTTNNVGMAKMPGFRIIRVGADGTYSTTTSDTYVIPNRTNSTAYNVGDLVIPATANGRQFRATVAGTTAGAQPGAFGVVGVGGTVSDGSVTWLCETTTGPNAAYGHYARLPRPVNATALYAGGKVQEISYVPNVNSPWATQYYNYIVDINDPTAVDNVFYSIRLTYSGLTSFVPPF